MEGKHWCFTINNPTEEDVFWENKEHFSYIVVQEERGENGTIHYQGYLILKNKKKLSWVKNHLNKRAHWEISRGTPQQASDYCKKDDTYTGGLRMEWGELPKRIESKKASQRLEEAADELDAIKRVGYKRPTEIPSMTLLHCGFIPAYKSICADVLGPYRPELKIITMIGPPGTGKSYALHHFFPGAGRCIMGNSGTWFQQPTAECMVFEEFAGQIQLQRMLQYLDVYPLALEVKGSMAPAMYKVVIITSNTNPSMWYKEDINNPDPKRRQAIEALWDRIGYSDGNYVPVRKCGHYLEALDSFTIEQAREYFWNELARIFDRDPIEDTEDELDTQEERRAIGY